MISVDATAALTDKGARSSRKGAGAVTTRRWMIHGMTTFSAALDWVGDRLGRSLYLEVGIKDPSLADASFFPVKQHVVLREIKIGEDIGHEGRVIASIPFGGNNDRLFIDEARITNVEIDSLAGMRITFHNSIYIGLTG